jgi:Chitobiase/beta-hexosaminidase C-terminal domain
MSLSTGGARHWRGASGAGDTPEQGGRNSGRLKVGATIAVAAVSMGALGVWSATAGAAIAPLPTFPDNLVLFPNRDFITIEGFADHVGESATIEVVRAGVGVVGSAIGEVSGADVAFEVNHPGGYCWGAGTGLNVTPDIIAGDEVTIAFNGGPVAASTTVQGASVTIGSYIDPADPNGLTMKVEGVITPGFDTASFEQRIIEPALRDTEIARRDIRALFGDLTPDPRGTYQSGVALTAPDHWVATYVFQDASTAAIAAAATGERTMTWQFTDPAANRQGLTIAEFGEPGGPGMGGCPNGPLQSGPPAPTGIVATIINGGSAIQVDWTPAVAIPGTPAIDGYRVTAVGPLAGNERLELGKSITGVATSSTIITGFGQNGVPSADQFSVQISSLSSAGYTFPAATALPAVDTVAPIASASVAAGSYATPFDVTLTADDPNAEIYFTLDGSSPLDTAGGGATPSVTASQFLAPIPVTGSTQIKFVAFDLFGNASDVVTVNYEITNQPSAGTPTGVVATPGISDVAVSWGAADPVAPGATITKYDVRVYDAVGAASPIADVEVNGDVFSAVVSGLASETNYWVSVAARNSVNPLYGAETVRTPITTLGVTANAGVDQLNVARNTLVQLAGTGSAGAGVTYQWTQLGNASGTIAIPAGGAVTLQNANTLTPRFQLVWTGYPQYSGPLFFRLTVTRPGGASATDVVSVVPRLDTFGITTARFKPGDFRVTGTGATEGATITVYRPNGTTLGMVVVVAGAWDLRLRGAAANNNPGTVFASSSVGGTVGPVAVR